jgi:MFS superfamily sulfate permease-like transporter
LAGAPLQVSGPAAGLTVVVAQCIREYGIEELGAVVLLAGVFQVLGGLLHLGQWFRAVTPAVVQGMLAGIGVLIFSSQFHVMVDDKPKETGVANLLTIPEAIVKAIPDLHDPDNAVERAARMRLLKETGLLHLKQTEIGEEVHHRLTGIAATPATPTDQTVTDAPQPVDEAKLTARKSAKQQLHDLAAAQKLVIERLRVANDFEPTEGLLLAQVASAKALVDLEEGRIDSARQSQDEAADAIAGLRDSLKSHRWAAGLGLLTIIVLVVWQATFARRLKFLPAPLIAVGVATIVAVGLDLPVLYVEVPDNLREEIFLPSLAELKKSFEPGLLLMAAQIAIVASAQTLLSATAVDQMHRGPRTRYDKELIAQGVGNMACGALAALPLAGVIIRSSANIQAGAKSRWSSVLHGVWMLVFVAGLSFALRTIPTASLAAILVYTGYKLVNIKTLKSLLVFGRSEAAIYVGTMAAIVATDLLSGVLFGLGLSIAKLLYTFSRLRITLRHDQKHNRATLSLRGSATFLRLPKLARALEKIPPGSELHVDFSRLAYIDHACLDLLMNWQKQHEGTGGKLVLDWQALRGRFTSEPVTGTASSDSPKSQPASKRGSRPREHHSSTVEPGD